MKISRGILWVATLGMVFNLTGCGSSSSSSSSTAPTVVTLSGTVSAPGAGTGAIAFAKPDNSLLHMFASLFSSQQALADAIAATAPVGSGVIVDLIQIDDTGNQVSGVIATGTTTSTGSYSIDAPASFVPATNYVVRANGTTGYLDAIVTSTTVDVDPGTDVTKDLVITAASGVGITNVSTQEVAEIQKTVENLADEIDSTSFTDPATTKALIIAQSTNDEEASNIISSIVSGGMISGNVTDSSNTPLPNIKIVVRDFNNWVTRAVTRTDALGAYTLNVPPGDYILGAINMTETSTAASEWWTASGGAANMFSSEKVTVATTITKDFVLDPGVRISGTVAGAISLLPVRGIQVQLRDFINDQPVATTRTDIDGKYRINVRPGSYTLGAYNLTAQPYATQLYNSALPNGGTNASQAEKITLVLGTPKTANFSLQDGRVIAGTVSDGVNPVPGMAVRFYASTGAFVRGVRTNKIGKYRLWLFPNSSAADQYIVRSRGQTLQEDISASGQLAQDFTAAVGQVTAILKDIGGNPISQAKVGFYDTSASYVYQGFETSNGDGSVTIYSTITPIRIDIKNDSGTTAASQLYNSGGLVTQISAAESVNVNVGGITVDLATVTLPAGVELSGIVDVLGTPTGDRVVQVRSGGTAAGNQYVNSRSQLDGSYSINVLPNTTYSVRACNPGVGCAGVPFTTVNVAAVNATQNLTAPN